ncbi:hypothetical protein TNCV_2472831 [Trichonephila clavipes]|nr:hypothetical protein TNCV_2472831 [Trichonephila clavipes]
MFENLSERLGIRHVKTVGYRPQANRTECVNRNLVQMIANYINDQLGVGNASPFFGGVRGTPRNSSACKQQQGLYTNYCCNPYGKAAPISIQNEDCNNF